MIIKFNSFLIYLSTDLTAQRTVTEPARVKKRIKTHKQANNNSIKFLFISMLTQQPRGQLQSEHE
jgi:hypothetical protein